MGQTIDFGNGFELALAWDGERFLGIGEVTYQGTPLRCAALPWTLYAESDHGFRFENFRDLEIRRDSEWTVLALSVETTWLPRVQEADAMGDSRIRTRRLNVPTAKVRWKFRPITERLYENEWTGLAMQVEVDCPGCPIHWLLEDTTWEIGGAAAGATLVQQDMTSIDLEQSVTKDGTFSTRERFFTDEEDTPEAQAGDSLPGNCPMDMMPRGGGSAPLDFQAKDDLALILFAEKPGLTRARIEKFRSEDVIHYTERPLFPMTENAVAPERKLLVYRHPAPLKRHEWRNLWLDAFTEVRRRLHANYGFTLEIPRPIVWAFMWNYDMDVYMDEWTQPLIEALPEYKRLGYTDLFTHGVFVGKGDEEGGPRKENICLNDDYVYSEAYGGPAAMKRLFDAAHEQGMRTWQWMGFYLSLDSPLFEEHPEWRQQQANGSDWGGAGRMRSGFRDHMLNAVRTIREETGLDGIFWDSYQNTGLTNLDWRADDKAPHTEEIWRFQAELQRMGIHQRAETVTTLGISNIGIYGFKNDPQGWTFRRRWWESTVENDDMFAWIDACPACFSENEHSATKISPTVYFWMLGHRAVPALGVFPWGPDHKGKHVMSGGPRLPGDELAEEYGRVNRMYNAALPYMHRLRVTEGGRYTLWLDEENRPAVIWAFADAVTEYEGPVTELESGESGEADGQLTMAAGQAYLLGDR